jgi:hypothetical protein
MLAASDCKHTLRFCVSVYMQEVPRSTHALQGRSLPHCEDVSLDCSAHVAA